MKRNVIKAILSMSLAASFLGAGFLIRHNQLTEVEASTHTDNYDPYVYSGSYYEGISGGEGLNGTLRKALTTLCYPKGFYSYSGTGSDHLSTQLQYADEDPLNKSNMIYLYTRDSVKKNAATSWNREHVWPQSLSNDCWGQGTAGADLLHIRPTYNTTNSTRGNDKYGNVPTGTKREYGGIFYGTSGSGMFEPLDTVKGDVARIVMYVWATYVEHYAKLPEITNTFQSYDVMMQWHLADAPDVMEGNRNNYCETSKQKNRNPFVDHPEYAWKIFGEKCSSDVLAEAKSVYPDDGTVAKYLSLDKTSITIEEEDKTTIKARASDNTVNVSWTVGDSSVVSLSSNTSKPGSDITITGLKKGNTTITAKATIDGEEFTKTCTVNVTEKSSTIIDEDKGLTFDNPLTPKEAVSLMEKAGNGVIVGTNKEYYVRGILEEGTKYNSSYKNWSGSMGYNFTLDSASNNSGVSITEQDGGLDGKEVVAKGYLEQWNGAYKMGYLPASASPTGAKFNPSIVYIEGGEVPPTPTPTPTPTPSLTITLSKTSLNIDVGQTLGISATTSDGSDVKWSLNNTNIGLMATSSKSGEEISIIGVKAGNAIITAKSGNVEAKCTVTITQPVITIELSETQVTAFVGETFKLKAITSNQTQVAWSKDNDLINLSASISGSGMEITVSCLEIGEAKITAKSTSGEEAYCYVTVVEKMEPTPTPTPTPEPTPTPTPTPEPEPKPSKKGCGGNVVSSSIIVSSLALSSLGFVLLRIILKKRK